MKKNILLVNSGQEENKILTGFLEILAEKKYSFFLLSPKDFWRDFFKKHNWPFGMNLFVLRGKNHLDFARFVLFLPFLLFWHFCLTIYYYKKYNIKSVLCLAWPEKIIYSCLGKIFSLQVFWLENPGENYKKYPAFLKRLIKIFSKKARAIVFLPDSEIRIRHLGFAGEIILLWPGVKPVGTGHQENIFSTLAKNRENFLGRKKYFTLGAVTDFSHPHQIENLFRAASICLNVIPNLQIIIIGEGDERKQAMWNSKKMGLENLTWFVGRQDKLKKWLDSLDVYVSVGEDPNSMNLKLILKAMSASLPPIVFSGSGQEDLIIPDRTGFVCTPGDHESLAQLILKLFKNKNFRNKIGDEARCAVENNFSADKQAENLAIILESQKN